MKPQQRAAVVLNYYGEHFSDPDHRSEILLEQLLTDLHVYCRKYDIDFRTLNGEADIQAAKYLR